MAKVVGNYALTAKELLCQHCFVHATSLESQDQDYSCVWCCLSTASYVLVCTVHIVDMQKMVWLFMYSGGMHN